MFPTLEVRWFYAGTLPLAILAWFQSAAQGAVVQPIREDYYLRLPDNHSLGIKLRDERIEIKQRHRQEGLVKFNDGVAGVVEGWRKWSLEVVRPGSGLDGIVEPASAWIAVQKERLIKKYRVAVDRRIEPIHVSEAADQGCEVELTKIKVGELAWWTLALEAFGSENSYHTALLAVADRFFQNPNQPSFIGLDSYSYPRWLDTFGQARG